MTVTVTLTKEEWDHVLYALSQFAHNPEFSATLNRVIAQLPEKR